MDLGEKFCIARNSLTIPVSVSLYDSHNKGAQLNVMVTLIEVSAGSTLKRGAAWARTCYPIQNPLLLDPEGPINDALTQNQGVLC